MSEKTKEKKGKLAFFIIFSLKKNLLTTEEIQFKLLFSIENDNKTKNTAKAAVF